MKNCVVTARVSQSDLSSIQRAAVEANQTVSEFVASAALLAVQKNDEKRAEEFAIFRAMLERMRRSEGGDGNSDWRSRDAIR